MELKTWCHKACKRVRYPYPLASGVALQILASRNLAAKHIQQEPGRSTVVVTHLSKRKDLSLLVKPNLPYIESFQSAVLRLKAVF